MKLALILIMCLFCLMCPVEASDEDVMSVSYYSENGSIINEIVSGEVSVDATGDSNDSGRIIAALYCNNKLVQFNIKNIGEDTKFKFTIPDEGNLFKYKIKTFALDNFKNLRPLSSVYTLENKLPGADEVRNLINKVNNYYINNNDFGDNRWANSVYHIGNMAAFEATQDKAYYDFSLTHAYDYNFLVNDGTFSDNADDQCIGQTYFALNSLSGNEYKIEDIKKNIDTVISNNKTTDWWWIDAIFMALPLYTTMGNLYNDDNYFEHGYKLYSDTKTTRTLYDETTGLWFRDSNWIYPTKMTESGNKVFWSRGNGWVFAALAMTLEKLPKDSIHYEEYKQDFLSMAEALKERQRTDGLFNSSLDDPNHYGGPETSGTSAFMYGFASGIRNGILSKDEYMDVLIKGYKGLADISVSEDGKLRYVQKAASSPGTATINDTADFGVGLYLLAMSEILKLTDDYAPVEIIDIENELNNEDNIALNKEVTATSEQSGNECHRIVDGTPYTRWSAETFPQSVVIDLGKDTTVSKFCLYPYKTRRYKYKIYVSQDGDTYDEVVDRTENPVKKFMYEDCITPTVARYVKLTVTGCLDSTNWVSITDFKVYGQ